MVVPDFQQETEHNQPYLSVSHRIYPDVQSERSQPYRIDADGLVSVHLYHTSRLRDENKQNKLSFLLEGL